VLYIVCSADIVRCDAAQNVLKVFASNGSVVARIPEAHLVPKLRHKLGKLHSAIVAVGSVERE